MEQFKGLLKDKQNALSIFAKAKQKLQLTIDAMSEAHSVSVSRTVQHEQALQKESEARNFLMDEIQRSKVTCSKIDEILGA